MSAAPTITGRLKTRLTTVFSAYAAAGGNNVQGMLTEVCQSVADALETLDGNSFAVGPLDDAATLVTDLSGGVLCWRGTVSQASVLANPTGTPRPLACVTWRLKQAAGGAHAVTLDTKFRLATGVVVDTSGQAAGDAAYIVAVYDDQDDKYDVVGFTLVPA